MGYYSGIDNSLGICRWSNIDIVVKYSNSVTQCMTSTKWLEKDASNR